MEPQGSVRCQDLYLAETEMGCVLAAAVWGLLVLESIGALSRHVVFLSHLQNLAEVCGVPNTAIVPQRG